MPETASSALVPWSAFYAMTASAAAALTGLMFVVITLVTGVERLRRSPDGISTFSTPTVVHFCVALFTSAILIAPWRSLSQPAAVLGVAGLFGIAYVFRVMHLTSRLDGYAADAEDWTWYTVVPFVSYGAILAGAIVLTVRPPEAMFVLAGGILLLIFAGIRNAWDVVTYIAIGEPPEAD